MSTLKFNCNFLTKSYIVIVIIHRFFNLITYTWWTKNSPNDDPASKSAISDICGRNVAVNAVVIPKQTEAMMALELANSCESNNSYNSFSE